MELLNNPLIEVMALIIVGVILRMNHKRLQNLFQSNNTAERSNTMNWKRGITDMWERMFPKQPQEPLFDYFMRLATVPEASAQSSQSASTQASVTRPAQPVGRTAYDDDDQLSAAQVFMAQIAQAGDWIQALVESYHLLIVGGTRGGKTVLAHEIAERRVAAGDEVYVIDPDSRPGMWPSAKVVAGGGDDFDEADRLLGWFDTVIKERREERRNGRRKFPPITLVISELGSVMTGCTKAREMFEGIVRRGAKLGIRMVADVQDNQVKTLKLEGASSLLLNLTRVEVRRGADGKRTATIEEKLYSIPQLTDPEALADAEYARRSSVRQAEPLEPAEPVRSEGAISGGSNQFANQFDRTSSSGSTHQEAVRGGSGLSKVNDRYELVRELVRTGMTGNKINDILGGTRSDNLDMVRKAKAELGLADAA
jgi:hypothetical protein